MEKVIIMIFAIGLSLCTIQAQKKTFTIDDRWVGKIEQISTNGNDFSFVAKEIESTNDGSIKKYYLVHNDSVVGSYKHCSTLQYSDNGLKFFYYAIEESFISYLHYSKFKYGPFLGFWGDPGFLKDGITFGGFVKTSDGFMIIVEDKFQIIQEEIAMMGVEFSKDGKVFTIELVNDNKYFIGSIGNIDSIIAYDSKPIIISDNQVIYIDKKDHKSSIKYNNQSIGLYDSIWNINISPDETKLSYQAMIDDNIFVFINNDKYGPFNHVSDFTFTNDSKNYFFVGSNQSGVFLFTSDTIIGPYQSINNPIISNNNYKMAYIASIFGLNYVVNGNEKFGPFATINQLQYYPNNSELLFEVEEDENVKYLICDKEKYGPFNEITCFAMSNDNKQIAYCANDVFFINDNRIGEVEMEDINFSKDNRFLSYYGMDNINKLFFISTNKTYVGSLYNDGVVYIDGNQIIIEPYKK